MTKRIFVEHTQESQIHHCLKKLSEGTATRMQLQYVNFTGSITNNRLIGIMLSYGLIEETGALSDNQYLPIYRITEKGLKLLDLLEKQAAMVGVTI